ncbi:uncharacterized protein Z518_05339 [Rhinocladiella mackenziei CBS 650.93]|uniref:Transcription factor domain-containing protein n=1 Tax=Rhinocladiella mackenziei CBS 650.93 TaxID=1442369 RepID=A0A0D2IMX4_9EURO|nr:uncharacterized protein Z518_05339 [Rhinocladiella mackenziei CBS 650.93]KIX04471.1 hypothetical protein Z518_05339 [Rhinocladiella mackenziei CBS 650.93]
MPKLHFVQSLPVGSSKRDRELERAKARAHAASVSYQKHGSRAVREAGRIPPHHEAGNFTSDPAVGSSAFTSQYGLHTPPESPERRDSDATVAPQMWSIDAIVHAFSDEILTPPESSVRTGVIDEDLEDVDDINEDFSSPSSVSRSIVRHKKKTHQVFRLNNPKRHSPPGGSYLNINIPHDLLGTRADPFNCIPSRGSDCVSAVVDYHAQIMAPNHAPIYKIFDVTNVYTSYYFELLSHPDFLYTGVASVQAVIDHLRRPGQGPSQTVLRHIGSAMKNLRLRLERLQREQREIQIQSDNRNSAAASSTGAGNEEGGETARLNVKTSANETLQVDDLTIITVLFLAVVTRAINDMPSHEVHKRSIATLVSARGGLDRLVGHDGLARCTLMQWESFWALNTGQSIFPDSRPAYAPIYPLNPIPSPLVQKISLLPLGFQRLAHRQRLALDVLDVLSRTAEAQIEHDLHGTIVEDSDVFRNKPRRFSDFWEACTCLGAPDEVRVDGTLEPNLEKLIILAVLLYCLHTFSPMRAVTAVYNGSRLKLTNDAPRRVRRNAAAESGSPPIMKDDSEVQMEIDEEDDVLLWIYFVLVDSWRAANDSLLPQGLALMANIDARFPERMANWEGCQAVLKKFFWNDKFIMRCRAFWAVGAATEHGRDDGLSI